MTCYALRLFVALAVVSGASVLCRPRGELETVRNSNAAILNRLGLVAVQGPRPGSGHQRKRLAGGEPLGRRHEAAPDAHDSHVYVVKLPASPPYYSFSRPVVRRPNASLADTSFTSNGRPDKIYHWNLPLVKRANQKKKHAAAAKLEQARRRHKLQQNISYFKKLAHEQLTKPSRNNDKWLSDPDTLQPRSKTTENATQLRLLPSFASASSDKSYRLAEVADSPAAAAQHRWHESNDVQAHHQHQQLANSLEPRPKKHRKKSAVTYYYAPPHTGKSASTSISKHFPGNGKPKAFYVMEKSSKPVYYHPLMP